MNDQITELRALVGNGLRLTIVEVDALLDCAEALSELVACHAFGGFVEPDPSVMTAARTALAKLGGDDERE